MTIMNFAISLRIILFFMFLGFFTASFLIGTLTVLDEEESLAIFDEFNQTITDIDSLEICHCRRHGNNCGESDTCGPSRV